MSSHHFVKEGQEPALFIDDEVPFDSVAPLLEWVPLVLVTDRILNYISQWGIKIDVILSQGFVDHDNEGIIAAQHPVRILAVEANPISEAMEFLVHEGYGSVNLICRTSDEAFKALEAFGNRIQLTVHTENRKWFYISTGIFQKWMPENADVFFRNEPKFEKIQALTNTEGAWKTRQAGMVIVESKTPFWIGEPNTSTFQV